MKLPLSNLVREDLDDFFVSGTGARWSRFQHRTDAYDGANPSFEGSTPLQVIERGETDRLWRMIWQLGTGNSG